MLKKTKRTIAASAVALAAVAGGSVAVVRQVTSSGSETVSSAGMPATIGPGVTATVPGRGPAASTGTGTGPGAPGPGRPTTTQGTSGAVAPGQAPEAKTLSRSDGQGQAGPLPAGTLPADGAVPGAAASIQALAAQRQQLTALPHSPRLLSELGASVTPTSPSSPAAAPSSSPGGASPTASGPASGTASPTGTATLSPTSTASPTGTASPTASPTGAPAQTSPAASPSASGGSPGASATPAPAQLQAKYSALVSPPQPRAAAGTIGNTLAGLDVAGYQHPVTGKFPKGQAISWSTVAAHGYKFAAVKATEGDYYVNPWAVTDLSAARQAGLYVAPYAFAIPNASGGAQQAQYALEYSGYATGRHMLPVMLDIEYDPYNSTDGANMCYGLPASKMTAWIRAFVNEVQAVTGQYPMIYTTANWWDTCTGGASGFSADPMWVAAYGSSSPPKPAGWSSWTFWQYSSSGTVPGVAGSSTTDLDIFSPSVVGLLNPGTQTAKTRIRLAVAVESLGAKAGEKLTWSAAGLPPGLAMRSGTISGVVSTGASGMLSRLYRVTVSARNSSGSTAKATFSMQVSPACARYIANGACPAG